MYLKSIILKNFRKFKNTKCEFNSGLNLIVGPNDSGKTAVIDAIRLVLKQVVDDHSRIILDDFNEQDKEINFDLVFSFDDCEAGKQIEETSLFVEYLSFTSTNKPELNLWYTVKSEKEDIRFPELKVGPSKDVAVDMDAGCKENLRVVYLRPLRDAENELKAKQGSRISKILRMHDDIWNNKDKLIKVLEEFKTQLEKFFKDEEGKGIKATIDTLLNHFDEQADTQVKNIKIGPTEFSDNPKKEELNLIRVLEKIALYYDDDLIRPGLGTLNMIFIAAELLHLNMQKTPKLILIEEVEAHLHPQRQLKIIKALQQEAEQKCIQMILTTHSPNLASVVDVKRLNICYEGEYYSLAEGKTQMIKENLDYLGRFLDVTKANLFFAQGVLLVEGPTEQLLIPEFAKILGYDLTNYGISVICTNGLGFVHFVNIFKRTTEPFNQIPIAVVTDADHRNAQEVTEYINQIQNKDNVVNGFIGKQLYSDADLASDNNKSTTFEKLIFETTELKKLYVDAYNSLKDRRPPATVATESEQLLEKMKPEKAPIAQRVAQRLSVLADPQKAIIKTEIETKLKYIFDALAYLIPKQTDFPASLSPAPKE